MDAAFTTMAAVEIFKPHAFYGATITTVGLFLPRIDYEFNPSTELTWSQIIIIFLSVRNNLCVSTGLPLQKSFPWQVSTETGMSFWRNVRHCLQRKLSSWQFPVQIMTQIPSKLQFYIKSSLYQKVSWIFLHMFYPMLWGSLTHDGFPNCKRGTCHVSLSSVARM